MKITEKWLEEQNACCNGVDWFKAQKETDGLKVVKKLIKEKKLDWANWLIVRIMPYHDYVSYAVYAAEQVISIYEKKYPDDKRPREAIEAAKKCIKDPSDKNKRAAWAAGSAAWAARAAGAAEAAAWAARAAEAAGVAWAAGAAAWAAEAAAWAAGSAGAAMRLKILKYGIKLLGEK